MSASPPATLFAGVHTLRLYASDWAARQASALAPSGCACSSFGDLWRSLAAAAPCLGLPLNERLLACRALLGGGDWRRVQACDRELQQLRQAGVTGAGLRAALQRLPRTEASAAAARLQPALGLLEAYEGQVLARAPAGGDAAEQMRAAIYGLLQGRRPRAWEQLQRVEVQPGCELAGERLDLLSALAAAGLDVRLCLLDPGDASCVPPAPRTLALSFAEAQARYVEARGHANLQVTFDDRRGSGPLAPLRAALYGGQPACPAATGGAGAPLRLIEASPGAAQLQAAIACTQAALQRGLPTQAVALVVPRVQEVAPLLLAAAAAGLPLRAPGAITPAVCVPALAAALELGGRTVSLAMLADVWEGLGVPLDGVSPAQLAALLGRLEGQAVLWTQLPEQLRAAGLSIDVGRALQSALAPLREVPEDGALQAFLTPLRQLFDRRLAARAAGAAADAPSGSPSLQGEAATAAACAALQDAARAVACLPLPAAPWRRSEVASWLRGTLSTALPNAADPSALAVGVLSLEQAVGGRYAHLVWVGCPYAAFPRTPSPALLLDDAGRAQLQQLLGVRALARGGLAPGARDLWLFAELLAGVEASLDVVVVREHAEDGLADNAWAASLAAAVDGHVWSAPSAATQALQPASAQSASVQRRLQVAQCSAAGEARFAAPLLPQLRAGLEALLHSPSRLDALGMCAYRYFAASALGLAEPSQVAMGVTPKERGSAAHAALCGLYRAHFHGSALAAVDQPPAETLAQAAAWVEAHATALFAPIPVHPLLRPALLQGAQQAVAQVLAADLAASPRAQPLALEYRFDERPSRDGSASGAALQLQVPLPGAAPLALKVRGSIDRVDRCGTQLRVIDYKSSIQKRGPGRHFQLALYAAVALRDWRAGACDVSASWWDLGSGKIVPAAELGGEPSTVQARLWGPLAARLGQVVGGRLDPDPDPAYAQLCQNCSYRGLCRYRAPVGDETQEEEVG